MKRIVAFAVLLLFAVGSGFAEEPPGGTGGGNEPLRMEELEVYGSAPLVMEELEVRGLRETPEDLYLPVHRGVALPSPVRYDLFLGDIERPGVPWEILPGTTRAESPFAPGSSPGSGSP